MMSAFVIGTKAELTRSNDDGGALRDGGTSDAGGAFRRGRKKRRSRCDAVFRRRAAGHRRTGAPIPAQ